MADDQIEDGKIYLLSGAKLKQLFAQTKQVRGMAGHIDVGTESDGCVSLKYAQTIQVEVLDPVTSESILLTVPYIRIDAPSVPLVINGVLACENGNEVTKNILVRNN